MENVKPDRDSSQGTDPETEVETTETDIPFYQAKDIHLPELEKGHTQRAFLLEQIRAAGGSKAWLKGRCPRVFGLVPTILSDSDLEAVLLTNTASFWEGIEERQSECARCPPEGASCVDSSGRISEGKIVELQVVKGTATDRQSPCPRYRDFMSARRLVAFGVDALLSTVKISDLGEVPPQATQLFALFVESGKHTRVPRKVQLLIEGKRSREFAVVLFRNTIRIYRNASYKSVHVPSLIRQAKNAMTVKEASPILELEHHDVLILDAIDAPTLKSPHFASEITWLYERRRDQGLATIITTTVPAKEAFPGVSVLRV